MSVIAIDGPAGAGKSTVARAVARALGWSYLDTGAMYRAIALAGSERRVDLRDGEALGKLAAALSIEVRGEEIFLDGRDVSRRIRDSDVTRAVSTVAAHPEVRTVLSQRQRDIARDNDVVIEGRDIGIAIVPDADLKVWLTASERVRAQRRCRQLDLGEEEATLAEVEASLRARDEADASRAASPLARAPGALPIDSTALDVEAVVRVILDEMERGRDGS